MGLDTFKTVVILTIVARDDLLFFGDSLTDMAGIHLFEYLSLDLYYNFKSPSQ
jgi:hypothetical protein